MNEKITIQITSVTYIVRLMQLKYTIAVYSTKILREKTKNTSYNKSIFINTCECPGSGFHINLRNLS